MYYLFIHKIFSTKTTNKTKKENKTPQKKENKTKMIIIPVAAKLYHQI